MSGIQRNRRETWGHFLNPKVMNFRIELAKLTDLESMLKTRKSAILANAHSIYSEDEVVAWVGKRKDEEISKKIKEGKIRVVRLSSGGVEAWVQAKNKGVEGLYVAGKHQRTGIGRELLLFIEKLMAQEGAGTVSLEASLNAIEFYKSCGYTELPGKRSKDTQHMEKVLLPLKSTHGISQ